MQTKEAIRKQILSQLIKNPAPTLDIFDFNQPLLLAYIPMKSEVNVVPLIDNAIERGKTVAVPTQDPRFFAVLDYDWKENLVEFPDKSKGVYSDNLISLDVVEDALMLVPGVAFTETGDRLGRGSGFYDRVLRHIPDSVETAGICRRCQIVDALPTEPHDKKVSRVIILDTF